MTDLREFTHVRVSSVALGTTTILTLPAFCVDFGISQTDMQAQQKLTSEFIRHFLAYAPSHSPVNL